MRCTTGVLWNLELENLGLLWKQSKNFTKTIKQLSFDRLSIDLQFSSQMACTTGVMWTIELANLGLLAHLISSAYWVPHNSDKNSDTLLTQANTTTVHLERHANDRELVLCQLILNVQLLVLQIACNQCTHTIFFITSSSPYRLETHYICKFRKNIYIAASIKLDKII